MQLIAPSQTPLRQLVDIRGTPISIGNGKRTLLCFFRDPNCPFCNFRIFELTYKYKELDALGLQIVALFPVDTDTLKHYEAARPRPFPLIADTDSAIYEAFGVNIHSRWGKYKGIFSRLPTLLKGLKITGLPGLLTNNLMPADFLVDETGEISQTWYGKDAGDRIPFEHIELFLARGLMKRAREEHSAPQNKE